MELENVFNVGAFSTEEIATELYDMSRPGVIAIPNFLTSEFCNMTINDFRNKSNLFYDAPLIEGKTKQELKAFYYGEADGGAKDIGQFPLVTRLREAYSLLYKRLSQRANFQQGAVLNSQGIHHYANGSIGMGVHRDYSDDINLLSAFVLSGNAPFSVYADKSESSLLDNIETRARMLVLMRGPRNPEENKYRPYHKVGAISEERYVIIFRQKKVKSHRF